MLHFQEKCCQYWPELHQSVNIGHIKVCTESQEEMFHFTIRILTLTVVSEPIKDCIQHSWEMISKIMLSGVGPNY